MKKRTITLAIGFLSIAALALALYPLAGALAQGKGGGNGNGNKPPGGEESTTNLSYPANFYGDTLQTGSIGDFSLAGQVSYGCAIPETIETTTYPNTSCVDSEGSPQSLSECQDKCVLNGEQVQVDRIYWQKDAKNKWQAGYNWSDPEVSPQLPLGVQFIDWGDNLESKSWPVQVIRVETNTFSTLPSLNPNGFSPLQRFEVWHVFGQGTNELWGVHTTNPAEDSTEVPVPYVYLNDGGAVDWPYAVNVSPTARLNIAKLNPPMPVACPTAANNQNWSPFKDDLNPSWIFNQTTQTGAWSGAAYTNDVLYGSELNIKGSYVYGYNWNLSSEPVEEGMDKTGWWRLTFYTPDDSIDFTANSNPILTPPPDLPYTAGQIPTTSQGAVQPAAEEGESGGMLYVPQVDTTNNLTYIDICITGSSGGGGGSGKGGGGSHRGGVGGGRN